MLLHRRERETPGLDVKKFPVEYAALSYDQKCLLLQELASGMDSTAKQG